MRLTLRHTHSSPPTTTTATTAVIELMKNVIHICLQQSVSHSAARLISRRRKYDSIASFVWDDLAARLPISQMIEYKNNCARLYTSVYTEQRDPYLIEACIHIFTIPGRSNLRSLRTVHSTIEEMKFKQDGQNI